MDRYPLHFDVDLHISQDEHQLNITSPAPDLLRLQFAERTDFRAFLSRSDMGVSDLRGFEKQLQEVVDKTQVGLEVYVADREILRYRADEAAAKAHVFVALQYVQSLFGK